MDNRGPIDLPTGVWATVARRVRRAVMIAVPAAGLAIALVGVAPSGQALAQRNEGASVSIGGSIASTVAEAVSGIATNTTAGGGVQSTHNEMSFGEQEGLAISDASGGHHNVSAKE